MNHFERVTFAILEDRGRESLNPIFKSALGISCGDSKTVELTRPRHTPLTQTTMTATSAPTLTSEYPTYYKHAAAEIMPYRAATEFDLNLRNLGVLLEKSSGLSNIFPGRNIEIKLLKQTPWTGSKKPWPTFVNR